MPKKKNHSKASRTGPDGRQWIWKTNKRARKFDQKDPTLFVTSSISALVPQPLVIHATQFPKEGPCSLLLLLLLLLGTLVSSSSWTFRAASHFFWCWQFVLFKPCFSWNLDVQKFESVKENSETIWFVPPALGCRRSATAAGLHSSLIA